jgi:hypothetical protein
MKKYLLTLALTALAASPALAASHHRAYLNDESANGAYAYVTPNADVVVVNGQIVGRDPDASIRTQLLRTGDPTMINGD